MKNVTVVEHEDYNKSPMDSDVAILRLPTALTIKDYVQPVCLPSSPVAPGTNCVVTGWGNTQSKLIVTCVTLYVRFIVEQKRHCCMTMLSNLLFRHWFKFYIDML